MSIGLTWAVLKKIKGSRLKERMFYTLWQRGKSNKLT